MASDARNHYPHLSSGDVIGLVGLAAFAFVLGRSTAPHSDCPDRLQDRTNELLLVYARQGAGVSQGMASGLL